MPFRRSWVAVDIDVERISFVKSSISSILSSSVTIFSIMSKYMLAAKNLMLLYFSSMSTQFEFESCLMSIASILLLVIKMAARLLPAGEIKFLFEFLNPAFLLFYRYGSCIKIISELSCSIRFTKLSVAVLESCRFICIHLIVASELVFVSLYYPFSYIDCLGHINSLYSACI